MLGIEVILSHGLYRLRLAVALEGQVLRRYQWIWNFFSASKTSTDISICSGLFPTKRNAGRSKICWKKRGKRNKSCSERYVVTTSLWLPEVGSGEPDLD